MHKRKESVCKVCAENEKAAISRGFRRGERTRTSGLYVPNVALYRAELHPVSDFYLLEAKNTLNRFQRYGDFSYFQNYFFM